VKITILFDRVMVDI